MQRLHRRVWVFALLFGALPSIAQNTWELKPQKDLPLFIAGAGSLAITRIIEHNTPGLTDQQILGLSPAGGLDKNWMFDTFNKNHHTFSDILIFSEIGVSLSILTLKSPRKQKWKSLFLAVEGYMLTQGITDAIKLWVKRPRPYLLSEQELYDKNEVDGRLSFTSGHTANAAYWSFMTFQSMELFFTMPAWVKWTSSMALTGIMGYSRMKAGKHYFTDVIAGAAIGTFTGWIIPKIHGQKWVNREETTEFTFYDRGKFGIFMKF